LHSLPPSLSLSLSLFCTYRFEFELCFVEFFEEPPVVHGLVQHDLLQPHGQPLQVAVDVAQALVNLRRRKRRRASMTGYISRRTFKFPGCTLFSSCNGGGLAKRGKGVLINQAPLFPPTKMVEPGGCRLFANLAARQKEMIFCTRSVHCGYVGFRPTGASSQTGIKCNKNNVPPAFRGDSFSSFRAGALESAASWEASRSACPSTCRGDPTSWKRGTFS
jgi:hypothetical protein